MIIAFRVVGVPETQGSKTARAHDGRAWVTEGKGPKTQRHKDWRYAVAAEARRWQEEHPGIGLLGGPVVVRLRFTMTRPASHPKTRRTWPIGARSGDLDKLARSVFDSLTGTVLADDAQVVGMGVTKDYGEVPGVDVLVMPSSADADRTVGVMAIAAFVVQNTEETLAAHSAGETEACSA